MSIVFENLFRESNCTPFDYNGRKIMITDEIILPFKKGVKDIAVLKRTTDPIEIYKPLGNNNSVVC